MYLVDEASEAVVEALDLLLLVRSAHGQVGVDLQVQRGQQALVDRQRGERGPQPTVGPAGTGEQGAGAERHTAEWPRSRSEATEPPGAAAAADGAAGADPLGPTQTHGCRKHRKENQRKENQRMEGV